MGIKNQHATISTTGKKVNFWALGQELGQPDDPGQMIHTDKYFLYLVDIARNQIVFTIFLL